MEQIRQRLTVGSKVREKITSATATGMLDPELTKKVTGTVVYIHPQKRFYTVRFDFPKGTIHESYYFPERIGDSSAPKSPPREVRGYSTKPIKGEAIL